MPGYTNGSNVFLPYINADGSNVWVSFSSAKEIEANFKDFKAMGMVLQDVMNSFYQAASERFSNGDFNMFIEYYPRWVL